MKKFNMRRQEEGEPVDLFITSPALLASRTHITTIVHDEMIWHQIIVGLQDSNLSEELQTYPELNLNKAITMARRTEAVREGSGKGRDRQHLHKNWGSRAQLLQRKNYKLCFKSARFQSSQLERLH